MPPSRPIRRKCTTRLRATARAHAARVGGAREALRAARRLAFALSGLALVRAGAARGRVAITGVGTASSVARLLRGVARLIAGGRARGAARGPRHARWITGGWLPGPSPP